MHPHENEAIKKTKKPPYKKLLAALFLGKLMALVLTHYVF
ncbi:hypothetical protein J2S05_003866 [Alkalicoccobacillus murimartini]|uniref:Uncharacterized protein n=1 Tax=Alkalicoccobacillus murimartini TaxID=171685 RepID=A0ABT9YMC1_9BACI|nr:hypothetical protein [Alkalicoccobacillus murimartini]